MIQTENKYFFYINQYKKIIEQRNSLLKKAYRRQNLLNSMDIWEEQLSRYGTVILKNRINMIHNLKNIVRKIHNYLTDNEETLEINYESKLPISLLETG